MGADELAQKAYQQSITPNEAGDCLEESSRMKQTDNDGDEA